MNRNYLIYFCMKETCDVEFSLPYNSFNSAKDGMENFLNEFSKKRGKNIKFVSKEEFEKIRSLKKPEDCFYVRKKNSEAVIYTVNVLQGTFYNSFYIEKYGKVSIGEFFTSIENVIINKEKNEKIKDMHVTNYERGAHVSFVTELKNVLGKRDNSSIIEVPANIPKENVQHQAFISALMEGKKKLKSGNF